MFAAGLTFAVVFAIIIGTYWAVIMRPEIQAHSTLRGRMKAKRPIVTPGFSLAKEAVRLSEVPVLHAALARLGRVSQPVQRLIDGSGVKLTVGLFLAIMVLTAVGVYMLVTAMTHLPLLGLAAGALASWAPFGYLQFAKTRRLRAFEEGFPEAIDLIARALRAGHAFTTGLKMVGEELPDPVGAEFRLVHDRQNYGMPLPDALKAFAERVPIIDARFFVTAVLTQREAGGNLSEVLDNLGTVIRERFRVKRQVRVITAHARITGFVLAVFPPFLTVVFYAVGPETIKPLFTDPLGVRMVIVAIVLQILGVLIIRKLVDIEY